MADLPILQLGQKKVVPPAPPLRNRVPLPDDVPAASNVDETSPGVYRAPLADPQASANVAVAGNALQQSSLERARLGDRTLRHVGPGGSRSGRIGGLRMSAADFYGSDGPGGKVIDATKTADPYTKVASGVALESSEANRRSRGEASGNQDLSWLPSGGFGGTTNVAADQPSGGVPASPALTGAPIVTTAPTSSPAPTGSGPMGFNDLPAMDPAARRADEAKWTGARNQTAFDASPRVADARASVTDENMGRKIQDIMAERPPSVEDRATRLSGMPHVNGPVSIKSIFGNGVSKAAAAQGGKVITTQDSSTTDARRFSAPLKFANA